MDDHCPSAPRAHPDEARLGLMAYAPDRAAYAQALINVCPEAREHIEQALAETEGRVVLRVVTFPATVDDTVCTGPGGFTCPCPACVRERAQRVNTPPRRIRQPWDVKAA